MIIRIILLLLLLFVILVFIEIVEPIYIMMKKALVVFRIFEDLFDVPPQLLKKYFGKDVTVRYEGIQFECSSVQEACLEFGKLICETLSCYEK